MKGVLLEMAAAAVLASASVRAAERIAETPAPSSFTEQVSAELGYRHLFTDYADGGFTNDTTQAGLYTGLNLRF